MNEFLHLAEGLALLGISTWLAWVQRRGSRVQELAERLIKAETKIEAHGDGIEKLQAALDDVREHMARREDVDRLLQALRS